MLPSTGTDLGAHELVPVNYTACSHGTEPLRGIPRPLRSWTSSMIPAVSSESQDFRIILGLLQLPIARILSVKFNRRYTEFFNKIHSSQILCIDFLPGISIFSC